MKVLALIIVFFVAALLLTTVFGLLKMAARGDEIIGQHSQKNRGTKGHNKTLNIGEKAQ